MAPSKPAASPAPLTMGRREWAMLCAMAVLWGCSFLFFKMLAGKLPPFTVVLGRVGIAAVTLNLIMLALRRPLPTDPRLWGAFLVMGLLNNALPFSLTATGIHYIPSGLASILNASTPIFTVVAAHFLTADDRLSGNRVAGVLAGFAGVAILMGPSAAGHVGGKALLGEACSIMASASAALAGIYGRRFRALPPMTAATCQLTAATAIILPLALVFDRPWSLPAPSLETWVAVFGIALLSTVLAFLLFFRVLATAGATNLQLVTFLIPVVAIALGAVFLHERLSPRVLVGMAVIALGLLLIDGRPLRWLRRRLGGG
jgi:drug/metabolite transporter (DMT)-like permease